MARFAGNVIRKVKLWLSSLLPNSSPVSWECNCQCFCLPNQTQVPPPPSHSPTWWLGRSPRWCSVAHAAESSGCETFSKIDRIRCMIIDIIHGYNLLFLFQKRCKYSKVNSILYLQGIPFLFQYRAVVLVTSLKKFNWLDLQKMG